AGTRGSSHGLKSARMSLKYFEFADSPTPYRPGPRGSAAACQIPERSGFPLKRGTAPVISTLPSGVRGAPGVGWFSHWAWTDKQAPAKAIPIHMHPRMLSIKLQAVRVNFKSHLGLAMLRSVTVPGLKSLEEAPLCATPLRLPDARPWQPSPPEPSPRAPLSPLARPSDSARSITWLSPSMTR